MSQTMSRPSMTREIPIRREPIHTPAAWTAETLPEDAGIVELDTRCLDEIHAAAAELGANPLPVEALRPEHFQMPRCREVMAGEQMAARTRSAFDPLCALIERPALERAFTFERGQFQVVNNRRLGHRRTAYEDWPDPARRRHMVRIWIRHAGRPFYMG